ncbi:hypothetical protein [Pseudomonas monteilii]
MLSELRDRADVRAGVLANDYDRARIAGSYVNRPIMLWSHYWIRQ